MTDRGLERVRTVWERAAQADPHFAVCSDPQLRGGRWESEQFFQTGETEIATMLDYVRAAGVGVDEAGRVLDFGCGLGRLTRALAGRFREAVGVDVAPSMIEQARTLNQAVEACSFVLNERDDLSDLDTNGFDFLYSNIVLQHLPPDLALRYVAEFFRVVRPGGAVVFQLPSEYRANALARLRNAVRLRTRLRALMGTGRRGDAAQADRTVEWEMNAVPVPTVRTTVEGAGGVLHDIAITNATDPDFNGDLRYLPERPKAGWVSRQYLAGVPAP